MLTRLVAICDRIRIKPVLVTLVALAVVTTAAAPASASAATKPAPVLAQGAGMGSKPSAAVRSVQRVLRQRGYDLGRPGVDGRFGPLTAAAVRHLQADYGLAVDGIVGAKTRKLVRLIQRPSPQRTSTGRGQTSTKPRPAPAKTTAPRPTTTVVNTQPNDNNGWLIPIAAGAALAALCMAFWAIGQTWARRRRAATPVLTPIARELYLEGRSDDDRVGEFRGHALAATIAEGEPAPGGTSYLVDDVRKPAPIWVRGGEIQRSMSRLAAGEAVIGYVTVSSDAARTEADAPARVIEEACERSEWELVEVVTDRENGGSLDRPGLTYALERIAEGKARGLVVSDLRRVSRSIVDLGALMEWFRDAQAALIALDLGVDTSTPAGHELAATLITLGDWERERIATRTRRGLAAVRASGGSTGRPAVADRPELVDRINAMRAANMTLQAIADQLNAEGVPTLRGGAKWRPSSVQAALGYRRPGSRSPRDQLPSLEDRG
jgi:DNA invertase Pin-like site-specific DNA recombinase/peptidoglycan hydrolase-like protein with peptidoglycan-binding domain